MATESAVENRVVEVGGRSYRIARFRGFKAQQILRLSAKIGRKYPKLAEEVAAFERTYIEDNKLELTRTEAELRWGEDAKQITGEAWESSGNVIALKRMPGSGDRIAAVWPSILEAAEEPALDLLAVVSLTNEELADADDEDNVDDVIAERRKKLLHDGDAEEIVELILAGVDVARGQFGPLVGKLAPMLARLGLTMGEPGPTTSSTSPESEDPTDSSPTSSGSETSPSSSTDSPPPTGGAEERPSDPPGPPSDDSPSG